MSHLSLKRLRQTVGGLTEDRLHAVKGVAVEPDEPDVGHELIGVLVEPDVTQFALLRRSKFLLNSAQVHGVGDDAGVVRDVKRDGVDG